MSLPGKILSGAVSISLVAGAFVIGGGTPLSPAKIADATSRAADNSKIAATNTAKAERATRAIAEIADDVRSQLQSSEQLLEIQLGLEESSRDGAGRARALEGRVAAIGRDLRALQLAAAHLSTASAGAGRQVDVLAGSTSRLENTIAELGRRFDEVVEESRELNRKARGFERLGNPFP